MMGFGVEKVFENLDYLHRLVDSGKFTLPVTLVAPFISKPQASVFTAVCQIRWPLFRTGVRPFFKWRGETNSGFSPEEVIDAEEMAKVEKFPCGQWFDLHILANGYVTKCCIDETGFSGNSDYDVSKHNVLDIYRKWRHRRESLPPRASVDGCAGCYHLG
ncbi:MAG: hypothetical protein L3J57_13900 [Desulfuromusa sp.]|nr:hypothetical protein [Desulfuromusa sp.]